MKCHANAYILVNMHYDLYTHDCRRYGRSGKFMFDIDELCYDDMMRCIESSLSCTPVLLLPPRVTGIVFQVMFTSPHHMLILDPS